MRLSEAKKTGRDRVCLNSGGDAIRRRRALASSEVQSLPRTWIPAARPTTARAPGGWQTTRARRGFFPQNAITRRGLDAFGDDLQPEPCARPIRPHDRFVAGSVAQMRTKRRSILKLSHRSIGPAQETIGPLPVVEEISAPPALAASGGRRSSSSVASAATSVISARGGEPRAVSASICSTSREKTSLLELEGRKVDGHLEMGQPRARCQAAASWRGEAWPGTTLLGDEGQGRTPRPSERRAGRDEPLSRSCHRCDLDPRPSALRRDDRLVVEEERLPLRARRNRPSTLIRSSAARSCRESMQ